VRAESYTLAMIVALLGAGGDFDGHVWKHVKTFLTKTSSNTTTNSPLNSYFPKQHRLKITSTRPPQTHKQTMSSEARPIDPLRFAEALETLPLDALHAKAAELQNSIEQLRSSNEQMVPFADEGDQDCKDAMFENLGVITRMHSRVELIRAEVEKRGMPWPSEERERGAADVQRLRDFGMEGENGEQIIVARPESGAAPMVNGTTGEAADGAVRGEERGARAQQSGRLTDEELRRQLEAQMGMDDEEGVHL
jgi:hypothetical protein